MHSKLNMGSRNDTAARDGRRKRQLLKTAKLLQASDLNGKKPGQINQNCASLSSDLLDIHLESQSKQAEVSVDGQKVDDLAQVVPDPGKPMVSIEPCYSSYFGHFLPHGEEEAEKASDSDDEETPLYSVTDMTSHQNRIKGTSDGWRVLCNGKQVILRRGRKKSGESECPAANNAFPVDGLQKTRFTKTTVCGEQDGHGRTSAYPKHSDHIPSAANDPTSGHTPGTVGWNDQSLEEWPRTTWEIKDGVEQIKAAGKLMTTIPAVREKQERRFQDSMDAEDELPVDSQASTSLQTLTPERFDKDRVQDVQELFAQSKPQAEYSLFDDD